MSANLSTLHKSGLVRDVREGRAIRYFADMDGMRAVLSFQMEDFCGGRPGLGQSVINEVACGS